MSDAPGVPRRSFLEKLLGLGVAVGFVPDLKAASPAAVTAPPTGAPTPVSGLALESVTVENFQPLMGDIFRLIVPGRGALPVRLVDAAETSTRPLARARVLAAGFRPPFALLFESRSPIVLPQETYELQHPRVGSLSLFLVPIESPGKPTRYRASFS